MRLTYYRCPNCGQLYYSAANLKGEQLICERCGATIAPITYEEFKKYIGEKTKSPNEKEQRC
ncbi:MAG: hypothetical protein H5T93_06555 [Pseudothermotoga sp.]|uniref:hypothetical protein n=1 Tax=Pseudothermotoga sp. TaxID=2033661 RepID=UPI000AB6D36A|nr:hypothetical protein [Pseudothermotoga sp.]HBT39287.1 hypothetical protein [Pseudothermotoga sp.]HCO97607.1 hypothetical protein [Pseudothermotoga sp.]